jgi:hypothetical protein
MFQLAGYTLGTCCEKLSRLTFFVFTLSFFLEMLTSLINVASIVSLATAHGAIHQAQG